MGEEWVHCPLFKSDILCKDDQRGSFMPSTKPSKSQILQARYEHIKRRNFVGSSRLEGIHLREQPKEQSLDAVLAKYRALACG